MPAVSNSYDFVEVGPKKSRLRNLSLPRRTSSSWASRSGQGPLGHFLGHYGGGAGEAGDYGTLSDLVLSLVESERLGKLRERLATLSSRPCLSWARSATCRSVPTGPTSFSNW